MTRYLFIKKVLSMMVVSIILTSSLPVPASAGYPMTDGGIAVSANGEADAALTGGRFAQAPSPTRALMPTSTTPSQWAPVVETGSVSNIDAESADIDIRVVSSGDGSIRRRGVVYSATSTTPGAGTTRQTISGGIGVGVVQLTGLRRNTTYNVWAFAENDRGNIGYGDMRTFTTESFIVRPSVSTLSVSRSSSRALSVRIDVTRDNGSLITERGVVYSRTNSRPTLDGEDTARRTVSGRLGAATVTLSDLESNRPYFVRAYATNEHGTSYGATLDSERASHDFIRTLSPTNVTGTTASVGGSIDNDIGQVLEWGVVYSSVTAFPTIADQQARATVFSSHNFRVTLAGLRTNTRYTARAYARTNNGYHYGDTVSFTTLRTNDGDFNYTVFFRTADGLQVGSQRFSLPVGSIITERALRLPAGYALATGSFWHTIGHESATDAIVRHTGINGGAFMGAVSGNLFEPDRPITRIEVARMIYNLRGQTGSAASGRAFADAPSSAADQAVLAYVSSMNFMIGDADGKFRPYDLISRAEVAAVCNRVYGLHAADMTNPFPDTANHWARDTITIAHRNGLVSGYHDGTFRPNANMTRAEAAVVFVRAERRPLVADSAVRFADVPATHWAYPHIMSATGA